VIALASRQVVESLGRRSPALQPRDMRTGVPGPRGERVLSEPDPALLGNETGTETLCEPNPLVPGHHALIRAPTGSHHAVGGVGNGAGCG
jgi:hypothetical protein